MIICVVFSNIEAVALLLLLSIFQLTAGLWVNQVTTLFKTVDIAFERFFFCVYHKKLSTSAAMPNRSGIQTGGFAFLLISEASL